MVKLFIPFCHVCCASGRTAAHKKRYNSKCFVDGQVRGSGVCPPLFLDIFASNPPPRHTSGYNTHSAELLRHTHSQNQSVGV